MVLSMRASKIRMVRLPMRYLVKNTDDPRWTWLSKGGLGWFWGNSKERAYRFVSEEEARQCAEDKKLRDQPDTDYDWKTVVE